jgi:hypothetical protein
MLVRLQYLLAKPSRRSNFWTAFWCRLGGHKCGPWWYNPGGSEPDMRCKNCGDEL